MVIDATFWVAVSFVIFFGGLIYLKVPQKINQLLEKLVNDIRNEIDESEKLRSEAKILLDNAQSKLDTAQADSKEIIEQAAQETDYLFSIEDHSVIGGLGSIVADVLCENQSKRLVKLGLQDQFPESGPPMELYEKYGLTSNKIYAKVIEDVNR